MSDSDSIQRLSFPFTEQGHPDDLRSVGMSSTSTAQHQNKNTTYKRDYLNNPRLTDNRIGTNFKAGITNAPASSHTSSRTQKSESSKGAWNRTYKDTNVAYQNITKVKLMDDIKYSPVKKCAVVNNRKTTYNQGYKNRGLNPEADDHNRFYYNNFGNPRGEEANHRNNTTTHNHTYKGHWHAEPESRPSKVLKAKDKPSMRKKTTYSKHFVKPQHKQLGLQTSTQKGLSYANRFANKPRISKLNTNYNRNYTVHQQRVLKAYSDLTK